MKYLIRLCKVWGDPLMTYIIGSFALLALLITGLKIFGYL